MAAHVATEAIDVYETCALDVLLLCCDLTLSHRVSAADDSCTDFTLIDTWHVLSVSDSLFEYL